MGQDSRAIQLRYLSTLTEIAGDKTSTIVFPLPIDLIESLTNKLLDGGTEPRRTP